MTGLRRASLRLVLGLALVVATALSGFAHHAPDLDPRPYLRGPDGLPYVLCLTGEEPTHQHTSACDACVLLGAVSPSERADPTRSEAPAPIAYRAEPQYWPAAAAPGQLNARGPPALR